MSAEPIDAVMLAARLDAAGSEPGWTLVVVGPTDRPLSCAEATRDEWVAMSEAEPAIHLDADPDLEAALARAGPRPALLALDALDADKLDRVRSRLLHPAPVVVYSTEDVARTLPPHIMSWVGGSVFRWRSDGGRDAVDVAARIAALEKRYAMTSAEVIERAEAGTLSTEPLFAEWLVLLGRGALVGRRPP